VEAEAAAAAAAAAAASSSKQQLQKAALQALQWLALQQQQLADGRIL